MDRVISREIQRRMRVRQRMLEQDSDSEESQEPIARRTYVQVPASEPAARPAARPASAQTQAQAPSSSDATGLCCRICLGDESDGSQGRLFSPCLCRGTSSHVHEECLNSWRRLSSNPDSYWRCDQCRFPYKIVKVERFDKWQNPGIIVGAITLVLVLASFVIGIIPAQQNFAPKIYALLFLIPPWRKRVIRYGDHFNSTLLDTSVNVSALCTFMDSAALGLMLLGTVGFGTVIYFRITRYPEYFMQVVIPALAISSLANGLRFLRIIIALGLVIVWMKVYSLAWSEIQKFNMKYGEKVIGINERRPDTATASADSVHSAVRTFMTWLNNFMGIPNFVQPQAAVRRHIR